MEIVAVGIGNNLRDTELSAIASFPTELNVKRADSFEALSDIVEETLDTICNSEFIYILYGYYMVEANCGAISRG